MVKYHEEMESQVLEDPGPITVLEASASSIPQIDLDGDGLLIWVAEILVTRAATITEYLTCHPESPSISAHEFDAPIHRRLKFYVDNTFRGNHVLDYLRTCPIQLTTHVCLLGLELCRNNCLDEGFKLLHDLQATLKLFYQDIAQFHDVHSLDVFISITMQAFRVAFGEPGDPVPVEINHVQHDWSKISETTVLACKLCTYLIYRESTSKLTVITEKLSKLTPNPESCYLLYEVKRKIRQENHPFVAPPTKKEFALVRKGLTLMPSNALLRVAGMRLLFDAVRSPHRVPNLSIYRIPLRNPEIITSLLHEELQMALQEPLPDLLAADTLTLGSEFYAYRNLRNIMCRAICIMDEDADGMEVGYFDIDDEGWALEAFDLPDMINTYMLKAEKINPYSPQLSILGAYRWIDQCKLPEAIDALKPALEFDPLDADLVQHYIRFLIGGPTSLRSVALVTLEKAFLVAQVNSWSPFRVAHLYFLKAMLQLLNDDLDKVIDTWLQGFKRHPREFLAQFAFWTKRQCRKYIWPYVFTDVNTITKLKKLLTDKSTVLTGSESTVLPGSEPNSLPESKSIALPESTSIAISGSTSIEFPGSECTALSGSESVMLPGSESVMLPGSESVMLPGSESVMLPGSESVTLPESTSTALPESTSTALPECTSTALPESTSTALPESTSIALPESTSIALPASESVDTSTDPLVYAALLEELNILFPLASEVEETVSKLRKEWDYLMEPLDEDSDDEDSDMSTSTLDDDEEEPPQKIPVIMRPMTTNPNVWMF